MEDKLLFELERQKTSNLIRNDVLDYLYKGTPVGFTSGFISTGIIFFLTYDKSIKSILILWLVNIILVELFILLLYFFYKYRRSKFDTRTWECLIYVPMVLLCACFGLSILFASTNNIINEFAMALLLAVVALGFVVTILGTFKLFLICGPCILLPVIIWFFLHPGLYKALGGVFSIYLYFLLGMNYIGTVLFKNSLRLKIEHALSTYQATHDLITNLPNKTIFLKELGESIDRIKGSDKKILLVCFSINRVEVFNNIYGYQAGDTIIYSIAQRLKSFLEEQSKSNPGIQRSLTLPRPNAFSIIYEPMKLDNIKTEIDKLFSILKKPLRLNENNTPLTASAGYAVCPDHGDEPVTLLKNAHVAMFQASKSGGNHTIGYYPELNSNAPKTLELEIDLHSAIKNKEFVLYYQPIINIRTNTLDAVECLLRWKHPKLGFIQPMEFISITEETGLIIPIGKIVLEQACIQMMQWQKQGVYPLPFKIAVNVSVRQLRDENFIKIFDEILSKTGISPDLLETEITETQLADEKIISPIKALIDKGVSLSMDDYGTGYSGMHYLRLFKFNKIKIDKEFITDIVTNVNSMILVESIIDLGSRVGVKVLAEGVETKEQLDVLRKMGCGYVQGFYFSKPLSAADITQFLTEQAMKLKQIKG